MAQGMTSFTAPCPRASWDADEFKGRVAFIKTLNDATIPPPVQQMMIDGTGVNWTLKEINSGHSPQLVKAEELKTMIVDLVESFQKL
jgi:hypothetical protein